FLRNQELNLDDEDFSCLRSQKISGPNFLLLKRIDLIDCKLKVGPIVTLLNLITEINTGKLSNEKLIPVFNDVKNSKWLYSRYFYTFPFNVWSLEHFEDWILNNYTTSKKEVYNQCFFKIIRKIKEDSKTLEEIREFVSKLDKKVWMRLLLAYPVRIGSHISRDSTEEVTSKTVSQENDQNHVTEIPSEKTLLEQR
ncbi:19184_t:CDS:2, partial [Racocetra persica]